MTAITMALYALVSAVSPGLDAGPTGAVPTEPQQVQLDDGTELIVLPTPTSRRASLRFVVRAGSALDPLQKAGLAHLLEHLIFHGTYDLDGEAFQNEVRAEGGEMNAFTSMDSTIYTLDAPREALPKLAEHFLWLITDPALPYARLKLEQGVVSTESVTAHSGGGLDLEIDQLLFPELVPSGSVIGNLSSRKSISSDDLMDFYSKYYIPANTTAIVAGNFSVAEARALIERSTRLAPRSALDLPSPSKAAPTLPIHERSFSLVTYAMVGYQMTVRDDSLCRDMALLLRYRLIAAIRIKDPIVSGVEARCETRHGNLFLFALGFSRSFEGSDLDETLEASFRSLATQAPSKAEVALLESSSLRQAEELKNSPEEFADEVAQSAARPRFGSLTSIRDLLAPFHLDSNQARHTAKESFVPEREVAVMFSPFQQ